MNCNYEILSIKFKFKGEKTPTLPPSIITHTIWGTEDGGYNHNSEEGDIIGTISGKQGHIYIHERHRKLANFEKRFIDNNANHLLVKKNEFSEEEKITNIHIEVNSNINDALNRIFEYYKNHNTVPSFIRPDEELKSLYNSYLTSIHNAISQIPKDKSLSTNIQAMNIGKLGVVEYEDGTIMLSPFHPLMVSYASFAKANAPVSKSIESAPATKPCSLFFIIFPPEIKYWECKAIIPHTHKKIKYVY